MEKYIWEIRLYEDIIGTDIDFALNEDGSITINKQIISAEEAKEKYGIIVEEKNSVKYLEFSNLFNNSNLNIGNIASGFNNVSIYSDTSFTINPVIDNNYKNSITISSGETKINLKGYNKFTFSLLESFKIAYQSGHEPVFDDTCVGSGFISGSTNSVMWIE